MAERKDIDQVLRDWPYSPGDMRVRAVKAANGRQVLQMRVELGVLQLECEGRPDGERPGGAITFLDHLRNLAGKNGEQLVLTEDQCTEVDREFVQYYHRRICWLAMREFKKAVADADHTLSLMDFAKGHSQDEEWTMSHEQYRPFVLFHRTQAAALEVLEESPELAIEQVNIGLAQIKEFFVQHELDDEFDEDEMVKRLNELREAVRSQYEVGKTLDEQLAEAIAAEEYERAARLRDEITKRKRH